MTTKANAVAQSDAVTKSRFRSLWGGVSTLALAGSLLLAACGDSADGSKSTKTVTQPPATPTEQVQSVAPARVQLDMLDFSFNAP